MPSRGHRGAPEPTGLIQSSRIKHHSWVFSLSEPLESAIQNGEEILNRAWPATASFRL